MFQLVIYREIEANRGLGGASGYWRKEEKIAEKQHERDPDMRRKVGKSSLSREVKFDDEEKATKAF